MLDALVTAALLLLLAAAQHPSPVESPRQIVRQATRAVEGDSARTVAARWSARLGRRPSDRAAALGLAELARDTYDYVAAERGYAALAAGDDAYAAQAALGMAYGFSTRGRLAPAMEWFERAERIARAAGDRSARAEALMSLAGARARSMGREATDAVLDSAARLVRQDELPLRAMLHCRRAGVLSLRGDRAARAEARTGAALARRAGERRIEAGCLFTEATDFFQSGFIDSADARVSAAVRIQARARDRAGLAASFQWWGYGLTTVYLYDRAQRKLSLAVQEGEASGNLAAVGWAAISLGYTALAYRDVATADAEAARAEELLTRNGDAWGVGAARSLRARVAAEGGDFAHGDSVLAETLEWARRTGRAQVEIETRHGRARLAVLRGRWDEAQRELDSVSALHRRFGRTGWQGGALITYAELAIRRGKPDSARVALDTVWAQLHPQERFHRYRIRTMRAELARRAGDLPAAARELESAADELDAWRERMGEHEMRVLVYQSQDFAGPADYGVASVLAGMARAGMADDAFRLAERRRARELRDRLVRELKETAAARGARATVAAAAIDARAAAAALPDDSTALLEYVTGGSGEPTTLFVLTRGAVARAYVLPPADSLAATVHRLAVLAESGADAPAPAAELGRLLLAPAVAELPPRITRLLVVPDGVIHRVPIEALRLDRDVLVADRFAVATVPSAGVLAALRARGGAARPRASRVLAFGDAAFDAGAGSATDESAAVRAAFAANGGLPRLPASAAEARLAASYGVRGDVRLASGASEAYLRRAASDSFDVLHFATHAVADEWSPARTALALAPGAGEDGFLGPSELASLRLRASLVVLSACRTAGGTIIGGEGVRGLAGPLLEGGARAVVATRWRIGDRAALSLVTDFYRALSEGRTVGDALHDAKLAARRRGAPLREWAAFTVIGDPSVTVRLRGGR